MSALAARLFALIALLLGAGLLFGGFFLDRQSQRETARLLEKEGRRELDLLGAAAPSAAILRGDIQVVDGWCDRFGAALDRRITVIDGGGRVLGDSRVPLDSIALLETHANRPEIQAALRGGLGEATRRSWTIRQDLVYMAERVDIGGPGDGSVAVIRLAIASSKAHELVRGFQRQLWLAISTVYFALLLFGYLLGRRLDRRLKALRQEAEALGGGNLAARIPVDSHDELAGLARVLNSMAERLGAKLAELKTERDTRDAVLANLSQGIALLSADLVILHANDRFWTFVGVQPPSHGATARLASARQPALEEIALDALRRGVAVRREVSFYVDERRENEVSIVPVPREEGPPAWLLTIEDLKLARTLANLRREFVANVSHELKTPLTSIRGFAETLLHGGLEDEANRSRFVETIRAQAVRLEELVEDLLQLADLERPDAALALKDWDVAEVVKDMVAGFEDLAERRGLRVNLEACPGFIVRMDRKRIELALRNLLDNALKYTDAGAVTVSVERKLASVRVSVSDTGRGIEPEHLPRLFERFYRAEAGRARTHGGTGLGLSIVKHAVELHGGTLGVESIVGRGSTFWIEIPAGGPLPGDGVS